MVLIVISGNIAAAGRGHKIFVADNHTSVMEGSMDIIQRRSSSSTGRERRGGARRLLQGRRGWGSSCAIAPLKAPRGGSDPRRGLLDGRVILLESRARCHIMQIAVVTGTARGPIGAFSRRPRALRTPPEVLVGRRGTG